MDEKNLIVGCVGRKRSGKSRMAKRIMDRCARLFIFDSMGEHDWVPNTVRPADLDKWYAWAEREPTWAARLIPQRDMAAEFALVCEASYAEGAHVLGIEELPMLCTAGHVPWEFARIVRLGRHRSLSVVWTAQRMAEIARTVSSATAWHILLSQREPRDLVALAERCGDAVADRVAVLPLHDYLVFDAVAGELRPLEAVFDQMSLLQEAET